MTAIHFDQRNLIDKRIFLVCEITFGTVAKYRIATDEITIPGTGGGLFRAGLDGFTFSDEIALFDIGAPSRSMSVVAFLDEDIAEIIAKGFDLTSATASLYQWVEGSDYADMRPIIVNGRIDKPEYGEAGEELRFSLKSNIYESQATYPPANHVVVAAGHGMPSTMTINAAENHGTPYPAIFGQPGNNGVNVRPGSPCYTTGINPAANRFLVAGHHVEDGTTVTLFPGEGDYSPLTATLENGVDNRGTPVAYLIDPGVFTSWAVQPTEIDLFVGWPDASFSKQNPYQNGAMLRGLGDVLNYFLELAPDIDFDRGRAQSIAPALNAVQMDFVISEFVNVWEWLRANLLPIAPIAMVNSGTGWYPVLIERALADAAAVTTVDVDLYQWDRTSPVQYDFADDAPRNSFVVEYGVNARDDKPIGVAILSPNETDANTYVRASAARYGEYTKTGQLDAISKTADAMKIIKYWSRIYGLPTRTIEYVAPSEWSWLRAGMSIKLTDAALHITDQTVIVQAVEWSDASEIGLRLVWLEDLPHDDRAV